ncbi:MAG: hypothetical protein A2022_06500 [Deltaproteobacteria bacterium GWF2_42_12]|nr:MAG: hypothetical protein A2022_06500 [Deltaproteobacteria bacterium GWF2_42_12]
MDGLRRARVGLSQKYLKSPLPPFPDKIIRGQVSKGGDLFRPQSARIGDRSLRRHVLCSPCLNLSPKSLIGEHAGTGFVAEGHVGFMESRKEYMEWI